MSGTSGSCLDPAVRRVVSAFALALVAAACSGPVTGGVFLQGTFQVPDAIASAGAVEDSMRYLIRFPNGYEAGEDVPLVVFLHGSGDDDYDSAWVTSQALPAVVLFGGAPSKERFALLAPQAAPGTSWDEGRQPDTVAALVDDVVQRYELDPGRVSLTGWSMGGYGAWHVATRHPQMFRRVASVSGSGYGPAGPPTDVDVCALASVDLHAYHGTADLISPPESILRSVGEWESQCGSTIDLRLVDGAGHFETADLVYQDSDFYRWLLTD